MSPSAGCGQREGCTVHRCLALFLAAQVVTVLWALRTFSGSQLSTWGQTAYTPNNKWGWGGLARGNEGYADKDSSKTPRDAPADVRLGKEDSGSSRGGSTMCIYEDALSDENEDLGHGTFGSVYRHNLTTTIRLFRRDKFMSVGLREAAVLVGTHHPHVVRLLGVVTNGSEPTGFMMEYVSNDTLEDVIHGDRFFPGGFIPLQSRVSIALQLALALDHVHSKQVALINLSPMGIRVARKRPSDKVVVKIADLQRAKALSHANDPFLLAYLNRLVHNSPYTAPEIMHEPKSVSLRSDIYSLGILLWELLTRASPLEHRDSLGALDRDVRGTIPSWCNKHYRKLIVDCLAVEPGNRPSAGDLVERLEALRIMVMRGDALEPETRGWDGGSSTPQSAGDAGRRLSGLGHLGSGVVDVPTWVGLGLESWQSGDLGVEQGGRKLHGQQGRNTFGPVRTGIDARVPRHLSSQLHQLSNENSSELLALEVAQDVVSCACGMDFDEPWFGGGPAIEKCQDDNHGRIVTEMPGDPAKELKKMFQVPLQELHLGPAVIRESGIASATANYTVAVKRFKKTLRFGNELEMHLHSQLRHPNIVQFMGVIVDFDERGWLPYGFMMESVNMGSLDSLLDASRAVFPSEPLPFRLRLEIGAQFAQGLAYLHRQQIVHFDVKPLNLLLKRENGQMVAKVIDLGYSKRMEGGTVDARKSSSSGYRGTRKYLAPEIVLHTESVNEKVDVYSFGVSLWKMYVRRSPYEGYSKDDISNRIKAGDPIPLPDLETCEPMWQELIKACTRWEPEDRPSMAEVAAQLEHWLQKVSKSVSADQYSIFD